VPLWLTDFLIMGAVGRRGTHWQEIEAMTRFTEAEILVKGRLTLGSVGSRRSRTTGTTTKTKLGTVKIRRCAGTLAAVPLRGLWIALKALGRFVWHGLDYRPLK